MQEFTLSERQKDGRTLREHLENIERQTRVKPKELEQQVQLPEVFLDCWLWFLALNSTRVPGFGISAISFSEMQAYFNLYGIEPEPWEIDIIRMFDGIAVDFAREKEEKRIQQEKSKAQKK